MVLEMAVLDVRPGLEAEFENAFAQAQRIIASMPGHITHQLQNCLEKSNRYLLLGQREMLAHHTEGFRQSGEYQEWKKLPHHFYAPFPVVEHYRRVAGQP
jgi:heme-degrading monooxygenase HmoA